MQAVSSQTREFCRRCGARFATGDGPEYCMYCRGGTGRVPAVHYSLEVYAPGEEPRPPRKFPLPLPRLKTISKIEGYWIPPKFLLISAVGWR